jgi:NAD+ kinase
VDGTRSVIAKRVRRIGVTANVQKDHARGILRAFLPVLRRHGLEIHLDDELSASAAELGCDRVGIPDDCDVIVAIGGDGTILKIARRFQNLDVPIIGLKGGRLGFLAESDPERVAAMLCDGRYAVQQRMRAACRVTGPGSAPETTFSALNDVVVHSTGYSRMIRMRVEIGGKLLNEFSADGLIIATPTGSTAYSLSAGGPVLEPTMDAILLTPLNPHTMSMRPMVLEASETVTVRVLSAPSGVMITVDGQEGTEIAPAQHIDVMRDSRSTSLVVGEDYDFFSLLREKL